MSRAVHGKRRGFTLWELTMVLLVLAIAGTLAIPAFARFGTEEPSRPGGGLVALLRDARKLSLDSAATVTVRLDPKTLRYRVDTAGISGSGPFVSGILELGLTERLQTDQLRLTFVFRPNGAAFGDSVLVQGGDAPVVVRVDPWSGVARADSQ